MVQGRVSTLVAAADKERTTCTDPAKAALISICKVVRHREARRSRMQVIVGNGKFPRVIRTAACPARIGSRRHNG